MNTSFQKGASATNSSGPSSDPVRHYAARLYKLTASLSEAITPAQAAHVVLTEGVPALGATAGILCVLEGDRSQLSLVGSVGYSPERASVWHRMALSAELPLPEAVRTREAVWIESVESLLERYPALRALQPFSAESKAWAVVPLVMGGESRGGITFGFSEPRSFTDEDRDFASALAHQCAQALERAWLYESERKARLLAEASQRRFAFLAEASEVLAQCASEEAIFSAIRRLVIPRLADWLTIRVFSETGELMSPVLAHVDPALEGTLRELQRQINVSSSDEQGPGRVLRTGEPEFYASIPDSLLRQAVKPALLDGLLRVGMKGSLTVAVQAQGAILGILTLASAREERVFTPDDLLLARDFARRVALAIDNARVRAQEQRARSEAQEASRRATFLARASEEFASSLDYRRTLTRLAELAVPELADYCYVDVVEDGAVRRLVITHRDPEKVARAWRLSREYPAPADSSRGPAFVLRTGKPRLAEISDEVLQETARGDARHLELMRSLELRAVMAVPLIAHGNILGVVTFFSTQSQRRFDETALAFAQDLARRAALAVDNARLHDAEHTARQRAERAADRTARLQKLTAAMSEAATPRQVAEAVLSQALEALGAMDGAVWECHPGQDVLQLVHASNFTRETLSRFSRIPLAAKVPIADAARTGAPIWLESGDDYRARYPEAVKGPLYESFSTACLPLVARGMTIGALSLTFSGELAVRPEEREFLLALARQCTHALERARLYREAEDALSVRDEFLSIASHELKTPLTSLKLHLQAALQGRDSTLVARSLEKLKRADRQIGRLTELIEEMLDLSRIRTGRLKLNLEPMDLAQLARTVVAVFQEQAEQLGVPLTLHCTQAVEGTWDRSLLEQVLTNLLSNAMKYGGSNPIQVHVDVQGDEATITVTDHGIGIAPAEIDRLFKPFQRTNSARNYGGLGLGLYICRQIVEAMGGTISVMSQEGVGSSFEVRLPTRAATG